MYYLFLTMFLTLVLYSHGLWANSQQDLNYTEIEKPQEKRLQKPRTLSIEDSNLALTQPHSKPPEGVAQELYYPYNQSLSVRLGTLVDLNHFNADLGKSMSATYGFQYLFPSWSRSQLETGADLVRGQGGLLHLGQRWTLEKHSSFRPFYKLGLLMQVTGKEGLATFANHKNYFAKASIGFEDTFKRATSIRFDLEFAVNVEELLLFLTFGYSWGF